MVWDSHKALTLEITWVELAVWVESQDLFPSLKGSNKLFRWCRMGFYSLTQRNLKITLCDRAPMLWPGRGLYLDHILEYWPGVPCPLMGIKFSWHRPWNLAMLNKAASYRCIHLLVISAGYYPILIIMSQRPVKDAWPFKVKSTDLTSSLWSYQ